MGGLESLVGALPEPLRLQLAKVDDLLGVQHSGALALLAILLLILLISLSTISSGPSRGGGMGLGRKKANTVLLLGPCGSGKTVLYHQLLHGVAPETVTSMKESESQASVTKASGAPVSYALVDFPGHERLRGEWTRYLKEGRIAGVVFVVDSAEFTTANQRATAEFLYEVLTEPEMEEGPAVLVACHKSDAPGAKAPSRVKILLTQELDKLRKTRGAADAESGEGRLPLGRTGQPLNLDMDAPSELTFAATSKEQLDDVKKFVLKCMGVKDSDQP